MLHALFVRFPTWLFCLVFRSFKLKQALSKFRRCAGLYDILPEHFQTDFWKQGLAEKKRPNLMVEYAWRKRAGGYSKHSYFFMDGRYAFILWEADTELRPQLAGGKDLPLAIIAFEPYRRNGIRVVQIQGKYQGHERMACERSEGRSSLRNLKWERLLVRVLADWAKANGIKKLHINSAELSDYYSSDRHQRFFLRYDVTARRMGLEFNSSERVYSALVSEIKAT